MTKTIFIDQITKEIKLVAVVSENPYTSGEVYYGYQAFIIDTSIEDASLIENYYYANDTLTLKPIKPSVYHTWNFKDEIWEVTQDAITLAKSEKLKKISEERLILSFSVIQYDTKILDADTQAQSNINGKLQEIFAREAINSPMPVAELFWKDADNNIHTWTSQTDYKLWLQGLVIAISSRNTALYAKAWAKKSEVEALTDINDIINYDVTTGWD